MTGCRRASTADQDCAIPEDFLAISPDDSPGIKKLKKFAALDSTQRENLPEDLKPGI